MEKIFYNLSNPQKSILLTEQYYANTNINNICGTAIINEKLDFNLLEKALNNLIKENDSFLLKISKINDEFVQYIKQYEFIPIELISLNSKEEISNLENSMLKKIFNIEDKLFEIKMFKLPDGSGGFTINVHHIIADGWTLGLISRKAIINYSILNGNTSEESLSYSYIDYLKSEKEYIKSEKFLKDKEYWQNIFKTIPNLIEIPGSLTNKDEFSCTANRENFIINKELVTNIQNYCKENKISVFNFFMAIISIYMYKISNINDFVIRNTNFK